LVWFPISEILEFFQWCLNFHQHTTVDHIELNNIHISLSYINIPSIATWVFNFLIFSTLFFKLILHSYSFFILHSICFFSSLKMRSLSSFKSKFSFINLALSPSLTAWIAKIQINLLKITSWFVRFCLSE
jgi:hypothetical protein